MTRLVIEIDQERKDKLKDMAYKQKISIKQLMVNMIDAVINNAMGG